MKLNVEKEVVALKAMTVPELRARQPKRSVESRARFSLWRAARGLPAVDVVVPS